MSRKEFIINKVIINGRPVKRIIVDEHVYKHRDITDDIIIDLVRLLDGVYQLPEETKPPFEYYTTYRDNRSK